MQSDLNKAIWHHVAEEVRSIGTAGLALDAREGTGGHDYRLVERSPRGIGEQGG